MLHNHEPHQYGEIIPNRAVYAKRLTPVNCYYDSVQLKCLRESEAGNGVNYSRACGVLFTPSNLFRVYHSRDVAMRFFKTGEENLLALLNSVFTGYMPNDQRGVLVFGADWLAANSILDNYLNDKVIPPSKSGELAGEILNTTNLGNPLFYLPLRSEALELLRLMCFPDWRKSLMYYASVSYARQEQTSWSFQHENRRVYIIADLNLTNLAILLRGMMKNPTEPLTLICLPWQHELFWKLIQEYGGDRANVQLVLLHESFMDNLINNHMKPYWG